MSGQSEDELERYYPEWLSNGLLWEEFPWDQAVRTTMERFLDRYSLHDSGWITLKVDAQYGGGALAVFRFDSFWTSGRIPHPGPHVAEWPILLIRFSRLFELRLEDYEPGGGGWPRTISHAQTEAWDGRCRTGIWDIYDGRCELVHAKPIDVLCIGRAGEVYPMEDLKLTEPRG